MGVRPAYDLYGKIFIIDKNVIGKPNYSFDFSIADVIPANAPIPWNSDTLLLPRNLPAQYIVLAIEYSDPIVKKILDQIFYMKWNGVIDDKPDSNFVYVSMKEKMKIYGLFGQSGEVTRPTEFNRNPSERFQMYIELTKKE